MNASERNFLAEALNGQVVVCIGQVSVAQRRKLDAAARRGLILRWRGFWHNPLGTCGIGPLKVCYAARPSCAWPQPTA